MPTDAITALMAPDDESALREARVLAEQIRGQSDLGTLYQMSGHGTLAPTGVAMQRDAQNQRGALAGGIPKILKHALDVDTLNNVKVPGVAVAQMRARAYALKAQADAELNPIKAKALMLQAQAAWQAAQNNRFKETADGDTVLEGATGIQTPGIGQHNAGGRGGAGSDLAGKDWRTFLNKIVPGIQSSRAVMGQQALLLNRAERAKVLGRGEYLTPPEVKDLNIAFATMLTGGGGNVHRKTLDEVSYNSFGQDAARAFQYFTEHPEDSRANEFVKRILTRIQQEHDTVAGQVKDTISQYAAGNGDVIRSREAQFKDAKATFAKLGMDPGEIESLVDWNFAPPPPPAAARPGPAAPPAGGGGPAAPKVEKYLRTPLPDGTIEIKLNPAWKG